MEGIVWLGGKVEAAALGNQPVGVIIHVVALVRMALINGHAAKPFVRIDIPIG